MNEFQKIRTLVSKGALFPYIDPHESNPRIARRFLRKQVLAWQAQQSQEEPPPHLLPKDQIDIVGLHDKDGLSFQKIGDLMGVSRQAAHQMYQQLKGSQSKQ